MKSLIKKFTIIVIIFILTLFNFMIFNADIVSAGSYNGQDLAYAILQDGTTLISSSYTDSDQSGNRMAIILSSMGIMEPTDGPTFVLFSTGIAGSNPVTTDEEIPGDERGTCYRNKYGHPRDEVVLTMELQVPLYMHYLYYDVQFFSSEYPEYIGTEYNDRLSITVDSPSKGISEFLFDVNNGYFVLDSHDISGTGFDIFAQSGDPTKVDLVDQTPRDPGADAGASDLIPIGGSLHPVSPCETINVSISLKDNGDNLFDSGAFIDNLRFSGYAKTEIVARKTVQDLNGGETECNDTLRYRVTISNTGSAEQSDNPGNEFEDYIPENVTYVNDSAISEFGSINYDTNENKIVWNGSIPGETSRLLEFKVKVNDGLPNGVIISNQGTVYWDSNENGINDATELTDDSYIDDGIDQDGDGETEDDDPTIVTVYAFDKPSSVAEDFSDDVPYDKAIQYYLSRKWFETNDFSVGCFEVVPIYYYSSSQAFKTKIRQSDSPQYWNYTLSNMDTADLKWWEIWFACGDACEEYDLYLNFKNSNNQDIAKLKFQYVNESVKPLNYILELYYWDPVTEWNKLNTDLYGGYLRNNWYKLRIEKNGALFINYSLFRNRAGVVDFSIGEQLNAPFQDFYRIEWTSTKEPEICPMFFWDEHSIGLYY
jgi:uncharacterized repeat protein (TIGR01451 family)